MTPEWGLRNTRACITMNYKLLKETVCFKYQGVTQSKVLSRTAHVGWHSHCSKVMQEQCQLPHQVPEQKTARGLIGRPPLQSTATGVSWRIKILASLPYYCLEVLDSDIIVPFWQTVNQFVKNKLLYLSTAVTCRLTYTNTQGTRQPRAQSLEVDSLSEVTVVITSQRLLLSLPLWGYCCHYLSEVTVVITFLRLLLSLPFWGYCCHYLSEVTVVITFQRLLLSLNRSLIMRPFKNVQW